jgi:hypothetical protein
MPLPEKAWNEQARLLLEAIYREVHPDEVRVLTKKKFGERRKEYLLVGLDWDPSIDQPLLVCNGLLLEFDSGEHLPMKIFKYQNRHVREVLTEELPNNRQFAGQFYRFTNKIEYAKQRDVEIYADMPDDMPFDIFVSDYLEPQMTALALETGVPLTKEGKEIMDTCSPGEYMFPDWSMMTNPGWGKLHQIRDFCIVEPDLHAIERRIRALSGEADKRTLITHNSRKDRIFRIGETSRITIKVFADGRVQLGSEKPLSAKQKRARLIRKVLIANSVTGRELARSTGSRNIKTLIKKVRDLLGDEPIVGSWKYLGMERMPNEVDRRLESHYFFVAKEEVVEKTTS